MSDKYLIIAISIATLATFLTRVLPFVFFEKRKPSDLILLFEKKMPLMILVVLVFYAIRDTKFDIYPYGIPELLSILLTFLLHLKFKSALLSIMIATIFYMFLIQIVAPYFSFL